MKHKTKGGLKGHIFRRFIHIGFLTSVPFLYYHYIGNLTVWLGVSASVLLLFLFILVLALEWVRLANSWLLFGMREFERYQLASVSQTLMAFILVLWLAPKPGFGVLLCLSCAWLDPLLGELRSTRWLNKYAVFIGLCASFLIWFVGLSLFNLSFAWLWLSVVVVLVELPNIKNIDDNVLMLTVPLILINFVFLFL